jgi:hypothetical protein
MKSLRLAFALLVLLAAAACGPEPTRTAWTAGDLRLLDPLDSASPSTDILAVYTRTSGSDLEIRIDLLDLPLVPDYDLELRLTSPQGNWILRLPADSAPLLTPATPGLAARLVRDPWLDTVTVRFNRLAFPSYFDVEVLSSPAGNATPADRAGPATSWARPGSRQAPVVLAFWDVLPAATPAQALRRWDGAHTGPTGERHGLRHILEAAGQYRLPLALLDALTPSSLGALDFLGATDRLKSLLAQDLLILPETAYSRPADLALEFSRRSARGFGLPSSPFVYSPAGELQSGYRAQFLALPDPTHLGRSGGSRLIPLPPADELQATDQGPSLQVRRRLVAAALSADPNDLVVLGGRLPVSTWGDSDMAGPTFAWLAGHPWVQVLNGFDLLTFPGAAQEAVPQAPAGPTTWSEALEAAPDNPLDDAARLAGLSLSTPGGGDSLQALQQVYMGQVGILLAAADWAEGGSLPAGCERDLDGDGQAECLLSNQAYLAVIEPEGARLSQLFYRDQAGPHQLVGPSSQFAVGLSDASQWRPGLGEAADPSVVPGAFVDDTLTWELYRAEAAGDHILFTSPDGSRLKLYRLSGSGLQVTYQTSTPVRTRLVLAVDPQAFFLGPTRYQAVLTPHTWSWGLQDGIRAEVSSQTGLSAQGFTSAWPFARLAEDPNLAYPPGHYLPFPISLVAMAGAGQFEVQITVK